MLLGKPDFLSAPFARGVGVGQHSQQRRALDPAFDSVGKFRARLNVTRIDPCLNRLILAEAFDELLRDSRLLVQVRLCVAQKKHHWRLECAVLDFFEIRKITAKLDHDPAHHECASRLCRSLQVCLRKADFLQPCIERPRIFRQLKRNAACERIILATGPRLGQKVAPGLVDAQPIIREQYDKIALCKIEP